MRFQKAAGLLALAPLFLTFLPAVAQTPQSDTTPKALFQESALFDALLEARDKASRAESDPEMVPVLKAIAAQVAQQVANLSRVDVYAKTQGENLGLALQKAWPQKDIGVIGSNFQTLSQGSDQIRSNLYYLSVRCRMADSQALPDHDMYMSSLLILRQVQKLQLALNMLYRDTVSCEKSLQGRRDVVDPYSFIQFHMFKRSVLQLQPSIYRIYNAGYALAKNCK